MGKNHLQSKKECSDERREELFRHVGDGGC